MAKTKRRIGEPKKSIPEHIEKLKNPGTVDSDWPVGCDPRLLHEEGRLRTPEGILRVPDKLPGRNTEFVAEYWLLWAYRVEYGFDCITGKDLEVQFDSVTGYPLTNDLEDVTVVEAEVCSQCGYRAQIHPKDARRMELELRVLCNGKRVKDEKAN
jgi:hypothetical protein